MYLKNRLQYILQLYKTKIPIYNYHNVNNKYISTVTLNMNNKNLKIKSEHKQDKKDNNNSDVIIAYNCINSATSLKDINQVNGEENKEVILVDVENAGYKYLNKNAKVIGFISKQCLYNKIDKIKKYMDIEVYDGNDKNGADTMMVFYIGKNINLYIKNKTKITIISNDSFAKCALNILKKYNINCKLKKQI